MMEKLLLLSRSSTLYQSILQSIMEDWQYLWDIYEAMELAYEVYSMNFN